VSLFAVILRGDNSMRPALKFITGIIALVFAVNVTAQVSCNLSLNATPVGTSCSNLCNGSVILTPSGGTAPYSFNAFDHSFPGTSVDAAIFDVRNGNYQVAGNVLIASPNTSVSTNYDNAIATKQAFNAAGKIVAEASFYIDYNTYGYWGLASNAVITNQYQLPISFYFNYGTLYISNNGSNTMVGGYSANTWYDFKIEKTGTTVSYYIRLSGLTTYSLIATQSTGSVDASYKLAATYRNLYNLYGGFKSMNWKIGGNPPTTGLCSGDYTYTVYDAVGCYTSATVTVGDGTGPSSMILSGSVTPASCPTATDGAISLTPVGGNAPYSYGLTQNFQGTRINTSIFELRNGNFSQNSDLREGVNYSVNTGWDNSIATRQTFSDGGYLEFEGSFKFDANADVAFGFASNGVIDGLAKILIGFRISGGTILYAYTNNAGLKSLGTINTNTWYDFKIKKTGSSVAFYTRLNGAANYTLAYSTVYSVNVIEYKFAAVNYSNYSSASGGYNSKNWHVLVNPKLTQLTPGTYTYTITDASGCTATSVFSVGQASNPVTLNATLISGSVINGATGAVSLNPVGGAAPYKFQFEEGFNDSLINVGVFTVRNGWFNETTDLGSTSLSSNQSWDNSISTNLAFTDAGSLTFAGSFKFDASVKTMFGFSTNEATINDPNQMVMGFSVNGTQVSGRAGRTSTQNIGTITPGVWYDMMVTKTSSLVKFYIRNNGNTGSYTLLYAMPYADTLKEFKAALLVYGANAGVNTKNWVINSNPPLSGLATGSYGYTVYDAKGCYATAFINVPATGTISVSNQTTNSSTWNTCDGTVQFNSNLGSNLLTYNVAYFQSFSGSQVPADEVAITNGAYSVNGSLVSSNNPNVTSWDNSIITKQSFTDNGYISVEMDMNFRPGSELYFGFAPANQAIHSYTAMPYAFYYTGGRLYAYTAENGSLPIASVNTNTWYSFKIERTGNTVNFLVRSEQDINYQLIYSTSTNTAGGSDYKAGIVNHFDAAVSADRSFSSRNWMVLNSASLNNICLGKYTYLVSVTGVRPVLSPFTINTSFSVVQTMTAPPDLTISTSPGVDYATGVALGNPTFGGSSSALVITNNGPSRYNLGTTNVTWTATDQWGNSNSGIQKVTVKDTEAPTMIAPANISITLTFGQTSATGVNLGTAVVADNVAGVTSTNNAPAQYPIGTTTVTWTATDAAGNTATATQTVTIIESQLPVLTPPANIIIATNPGQAYASGFSLGTPTLSFTAPGLLITNDAPLQFPVGQTTVTWTVSDGFGHSITAPQTVTVKDIEAPVIVTPVNIVVNNTPGQGFAIISLAAPLYTDNVPGATIINNAPSQFPIGTSTVTWTAKDLAGNITTASQTITVIDAEKPLITAPAGLTVSTNPGVAYASGINLGTPVYSDNASAVTVTNNASAQYPLGTTIITWTAKDAAGNIATATQAVTVIDTEKPLITAPANITVLANVSGQYAVNVNLGTPVYSDNVPGVTVSNNAPLQYPLGTTAVTWTATDAAGNTSTALQTVTVTNCVNYSISITSVPTDNTFTGGNPNNLYLGYGAQGTKLQVTVPTTGGPYTFQWTGAGLSSTTSAAPVFTPTAAGFYTFYVTVKNSNGCASSGSISICVKDIRVLDVNGNWNGKKVYVCHLPPGNNANRQVLSVSIKSVPSHIANHEGDALGDCAQTCNSNLSRQTTLPVAADVFSVKAYPNPTDDYFRIMVKSDDKNTVVTIRIVDGFGRTLQVFNNVAVDKAIQFGEKYPNGAYYAEVVQGNERKMIPLIKAN
jgi:hypothetical protein